MKVILLGAVAALALGGVALAQGSHAVRGYTRSDGTYVAPHMQTNPNSTTSDNWSTRGNVNPYTGEEGTKPDTAPAQMPRFERIEPSAKVTATCRDYSVSYSTGSGTCSSHGGVAAWH